MARAEARIPGMDPALNLWFLVGHIVASLWMAAGVFGGAVVRAATRRASSLETKVFGIRLARRLALGFAIPGSILTGMLGLHLTMTLGYGFGPSWIRWSVGIWATLLTLSLVLTLPQLLRTAKAAEASLAQGSPTDELRSLTARRWPGMLADLSALGLIVLVVLMVLKPA